MMSFSSSSGPFQTAAINMGGDGQNTFQMSIGQQTVSMDGSSAEGGAAGGGDQMNLGLQNIMQNLMQNMPAVFSQAQSTTSSSSSQSTMSSSPTTTVSAATSLPAANTSSSTTSTSHSSHHHHHHHHLAAHHAAVQAAQAAAQAGSTPAASGKFYLFQRELINIYLGTSETVKYEVTSTYLNDKISK